MDMNQEYQKEKFDEMLMTVNELSEFFEENIVFIDDVANYLYTKEYDMMPEESYDVDFIIDDFEMSDLSELYDNFTHNKRLNKYQLKVKGNEYDVYSGKESSLFYKLTELKEKSKKIQNIQIPCLEHLLVLKMIAFDNRKESLKGDKDARDIVKICNIWQKNKKEINKEAIEDLSDDLKSKILYNLALVCKDNDVFDYLSNGNKKDASKLRNDFLNAFLLFKEITKLEQNNLKKYLSIEKIETINKIKKPKLSNKFGI